MRRGLRGAQRGGGRAGLLFPARSGQRGHRHHRRHDQHQRQRHPGGEVRHHQGLRNGAQGGLGRRAHPGHRLQGPQDLQRLQPFPAFLRLGGHPGGGHRSHHEDSARPGLCHQRPPGVPGHPERRRRGHRDAHHRSAHRHLRDSGQRVHRGAGQGHRPEGGARRGLHDHAGAGRPQGGGAGLREAGGRHRGQVQPTERQVDRRPGGKGSPVGGPPPPSPGHEPPQARLPPGAPDGRLRGAHDQDPRDHSPNPGHRRKTRLPHRHLRPHRRRQPARHLYHGREKVRRVGGGEKDRAGVRGADRLHGRHHERRARPGHGQVAGDRKGAGGHRPGGDADRKGRHGPQGHIEPRQDGAKGFH